MPRHVSAFFALPLAIALATCASPAMAQHDASTGPAAIDFASCARPAYPPEARAAKRDGTVTLAYLVGSDGRRVESKVASSSGHADLDETARSALAKCRFEPAKQDGKPIAEWIEVKYVYAVK